MESQEAAPRRLTILVLADLEPACLATLAQRHELVRWADTTMPPPAETTARADVIVVRSPFRLDEVMLRGADRLTSIIRAGSGIDNVALPSTLSGRVTVYTTPVAGLSVAELAMGLLLAVARTIPPLHASLQDGRWLKYEARGRELAGLCMTIVGFGRIGQSVARLAAGFDMPLLIVDPSPDKPEKRQALAGLGGARVLALDEALMHTDVLLLACPATPGTRHMIDARRLALLRPQAMVINVARGDLVDEAALAVALRGDLGGAGIDVHAHEPPRASPLLRLPNVVATPHVGAQTGAAYRRIGAEVLRLVGEIERT